MKTKPDTPMPSGKETSIATHVLHSKVPDARWLAHFQDWLKTLRFPCALFLLSDHSAPVLMDACRAAGYRIPQDVAVIAGGAHPESLRFCRPTLTTEDPITGFLISGPSHSPEHGGLVMGPAMDHQLIRSLFAATAEAARKLGCDADFAAQLEDRLQRIAPDRVGHYGQLQE